jgi:hypothetical protein
MPLRQFIGILLGAALGLPVGLLLNQTQPWVRDWYFLAMGALVGAVLGGTATKRRDDNYSWSLLTLAIGGAILGSTIPNQKWNRSLEGAFLGFALAVLVLVARWASARPISPNGIHQEADPRSTDSSGANDGRDRQGKV